MQSLRTTEAQYLISTNINVKDAQTNKRDMWELRKLNKITSMDVSELKLKKEPVNVYSESCEYL